MIRQLQSCLSVQQFQPGFIGIFVNPFYFARKGLFRHIADLAKGAQGRVLDVGCGQKPYKNLFKDANYIGLEIDTEEARKCKKADFYYDGKRFPFLDNEFNTVLINQVFEHVFNPNDFMKEVNRVMKLEGKLLMTVPFVWDEHEQPQDFARYTSFGLRAVVESNGFEVLELRKSMNDIRAVVQIMETYLYKKTVTGNKWIDLAVTILLFSPVNLIGELCALVTPKNDDLYLDNILLAQKVSNE